MVCWHFLISGRVQGVGYRRWAQKKAIDLGLTGWCRNLTDGRVECLARGPLPSLELLQVKLQSGPMLAKVDAIQASEVTNTETQVSQFDSFVILEDSSFPESNIKRNLAGEIE